MIQQSQSLKKSVVYSQMAIKSWEWRIKLRKKLRCFSRGSENVKIVSLRSPNSSFERQPSVICAAKLLTLEASAMQLSYGGNLHCWQNSFDASMHRLSLLKWNLLFALTSFSVPSQRFPWYPCGQVHSKSNNSSVHAPPFWQGLEWHLLGSEAKANTSFTSFFKSWN